MSSGVAAPGEQAWLLAVTLARPLGRGDVRTGEEGLVGAAAEGGEITQPLLLSSHPSGCTLSGSQTEAVGFPSWEFEPPANTNPGSCSGSCLGKLREFMETVSQVWSFKAGLRTGAEKALGWEADAQNRLPERQERP